MNDVTAQLTFTPLGAHNSGLAIASAQTLGIPSGSTQWIVQALTQNVRVTFDGTTPTASLGFQLKAGDPPIIFPVSRNTVIKVIQEAATASLQYQFGGY